MSRAQHRAGWIVVALFSTVLVGGGYARAAGPQAAAGCTRTVAAAGDMNNFPDTKATGALARAHHPDTVTTLGDQQYPDGSLADYRNRYAKTGWGQLKARTQPVPGHHEYMTPGAKGYFAYFGKPRYYAYTIGCGWRGYALNSLIDIAPQAAWLRRDLAAHPGARVLASWSDPRFSSGTKHGGEPKMQPFWDALSARKGVVLNGHEHNYERFAPRGQFREFVVGTGGSATYPFGTPVSGSQKRITGAPGILDLNLKSNGAYTWRFLNRAGIALDAGRG